VLALLTNGCDVVGSLVPNDFVIMCSWKGTLLMCSLIYKKNYKDIIASVSRDFSLLFPNEERLLRLC